MQGVMLGELREEGAAGGQWMDGRKGGEESKRKRQRAKRKSTSVESRGDNERLWCNA